MLILSISEGTTSTPLYGDNSAGEPYAGKPRVRFGGEGGLTSRSYPIKKKPPLPVDPAVFTQTHFSRRQEKKCARVLIKFFLLRNCARRAARYGGFLGSLQL